MAQPKTLRLILGDQLDELHSWFKTADKNVTYVMMEVRQETDYVKHHIQKVAAFFAAMRAFSARISELGHKVIYLRLDDRQNLQTIPANLQHLVATKPYISSAKYIRSMSDYCGTCDYDWKKRHGDMACPFNSLYWDFYSRHRRRLGKNARVAMMYRVWDRMDKDEKKRVLAQANTYLKDLNRL